MKSSVNEVFVNEVLYHFTSRFHIPLILKDRFLRVTDSNLKEDDVMYKQVVWLTRSIDGKGNVPDGATHGFSGPNKEEIRITLKKRNCYEPWVLWSKDNRMSTKRIKLISRGTMPHDWYVSENEISLTVEEVVRIENMTTGEVLIDVEAGIRTCRIDVADILANIKDVREDTAIKEYYADRDLGLEEIVEFSI